MEKIEVTQDPNLRELQQGHPAVAHQTLVAPGVQRAQARQKGIDFNLEKKKLSLVARRTEGVYWKRNARSTIKKLTQ